MLGTLQAAGVLPKQPLRPRVVRHVLGSLSQTGISVAEERLCWRGFGLVGE